MALRNVNCRTNCKWAPANSTHLKASKLRGLQSACLEQQSQSVEEIFECIGSWRRQGRDLQRKQKLYLLQLPFLINYWGRPIFWKICARVGKCLLKVNKRIQIQNMNFVLCFFKLPVSSTTVTALVQRSGECMLMSSCQTESIKKNRSLCHCLSPYGPILLLAESVTHRIGWTNTTATLWHCAGAARILHWES